MKKIILFILLFLFSSIIYAQSSEVCTLTIVVNSVEFIYIEEDQSIAVDLNLTRLNNDRKCKKYTLGISTGSAGVYDRKLLRGVNTIDYNFYKQERRNQVIKDLGDGRNRDHVPINFRNNLTKTITIYAKMPNPSVGNILLPGLYIDTVSINIEPKNRNATGTSSASLTVSLNIPPDISISLVDRGQGFEENQTSYALFYGTLVSGNSKGLDLIVKSNTGYRVTVSSEGNGRMRHVDNQNHFVAYRFSVNSLDVSLVGSATNPVDVFYSVIGSPGNNGEVINIDVTILNTENKLAGTYRDFIYLNAISN